MFTLSAEDDVKGGIGKILCCQCGAQIDPNPANMCVACLRTHVDISEGIPKQATIQFCRSCERYFQPPSDWIHCVLESRELLQLCLRKLKGLNRVKLIDAGFVWTEPHSKRLKVKLTIQAEVLGGAVLQQVFTVEYTVANQMCDDCHRTEAKDYWKALVQIRQKAENKKTFYYLEQLILKYKAHENTLGIKQVHEPTTWNGLLGQLIEYFLVECDSANNPEISFTFTRLTKTYVLEGIDFYFATEAHARKMLEFLTSTIACRAQQSKKLLSHDIHSNVYNYKFTFSVELVPVSKNSIICLPKRLAQNLGGINALCLVLRVTSSIHLIDPLTAQLAEISGLSYWRDPFTSVFNPKQLTEFVVMEVNHISEKDKKLFPGQGPISRKHVVCDVYVIKASDMGLTDNWIHTRSHLGHLLKPFDTVLGYNVVESNINDDNFEKLNKDFVPDVILVKKFIQKKKRPWKLKHLEYRENEGSVISTNRDYAEFLDDLEEDPNYRSNVNIYRNKDIPVDTDDMADPTEPRITLEEMLDDLCI